MAIRFGAPLAAVILLVGAVAAGAQSAAAVKPPANEDCLTPHEDVAACVTHAAA
jgi:hypothetical protein